LDPKCVLSTFEDAFTVFTATALPPGGSYPRSDPVSWQAKHTSLLAWLTRKR
jgi:hypothetical protein